MCPSDQREVSYRTDGHVAYITLDRPSRRNALTYRCAVELESALLRAKDDAHIRSIVLTGAGTAFCSGVDLDERQQERPEQFRDFLDRLYNRLHHIHTNLGKPTIAAVNGPARGAGCTMAFMCDMVIASESASFGLPEVNVGMLPGYHLAFLPRTIGKHKAFEIALGAKPFSASDAERLGIVNAVLSDTNWDNEVYDFASQFSQISPRAMQVGKTAFYRVMDVEFSKAIADGADAVVILSGSENT